MAAWVRRAGALVEDRQVFLEQLTAWPRSDEAAGTLSDLRREGVLSTEEFLRVSSERLRRATAYPTAYAGMRGDQCVQVLNGLIERTHRPDQCARREYCWIHHQTSRQSGNSMIDWPVFWSNESMRAWRVCSHRRLHPDIDDVAFLWAFMHQDALHEHLKGDSCDGCCDRGAALVELGRWRLIRDPEVDAIAGRFFAEQQRKNAVPPRVLCASVAGQLQLPLSDVEVALTRYDDRHGAEREGAR